MSVRTPEGVRRRCWRCGFLRLASPLAEEPVPLGVGWLFQDVTEARQEQLDTAQLRFRSHQLHRAGRAAAECEDPAEAAAVRLDFALAGFAEHALLDVLDPTADPERHRLVRSAASPPALPGPGSIPVGYVAGHPALQALDRIGSVRTSAPRGRRTRSGRACAGGPRVPRTCCARCCAVGGGRWGC